LTISVTDLGTDPRALTGNPNAVVTIQVQDYNDLCPVMQPLYQGTVTENIPGAQSILTISASDADGTPANRGIQYSIDEPLATQYFSINPATGVLQSRQAFDYESIQQFRFVVKAINTGDVVCLTTTNVIVNVTNVDDEPPQFNPLIYNITIPESTLVGTSLLVLTGINIGNSANFRIESGNNLQKFRLGEQSGDLILNGVVDRETQDRYEMKASVTVGNQRSAVDASIIVNIVDVNDNAPTFNKLTCYQRSLLESTSIGSSVVVVAASDRDSGSNAVIRYSFANNRPCPGFSIDTVSGQVITSATLDFETKVLHSCIIEAKDQGQPSLVGYACLDVTVIDENDNRPTFDVVSYDVTIQESALINTFVSHVIARDVDSGQFGEVTYTIIGGNQAGKFSIDRNTGSHIHNNRWKPSRKIFD